MPIPDRAYVHVPELRGRITAPEESVFRDMAARYAEFDARAAEDGRDPGWRLTHEAREATREAALAGHAGDVWVFAYGSLIWDPAMEVAEIRRGRIEGWRRTFCYLLDGGRGTPERPGLMAALDADDGHACEGLALRLDAAQVEEETERLWRREMITGIYVPLWVDCATPQGPVRALTFVADPAHERHVGPMPRIEKARMIARAEGVLGSNLEYLENLLDRLETLGFHDPEMSELHAMCRASLETSG